MTIVKSRGTWHSNQVRELLLSGEGVRLAEVYTAEGQVLMGTARWQQEQREAQASEQARAEFERKRQALNQAETDIISRMQALERELARSRAEREALQQNQAESQQARQARNTNLRQLRGAPTGEHDGQANGGGALPRGRRRNTPPSEPTTGGGA
jgi:circadian clock protein KaiC